MAKKITTKGARIAFLHDGTSWRLRNTAYESPRDTVDSTITYDRVGSDEKARDLASGELSGTLQAFLDGCDSAHKTTEGI